MASNSATHFNGDGPSVNSYWQIGQTLLLASTSMAQERHSFFLICLKIVLIKHVHNLVDKLCSTFQIIICYGRKGKLSSYH